MKRKRECTAALEQTKIELCSDVVSVVMSFLGYRDLFSLSLVNKTWFDMSRNVDVCIELNGKERICRVFKYQLEFFRVLSSFSNVKSITIDFLYGKRFTISDTVFKRFIGSLFSKPKARHISILNHVYSCGVDTSINCSIISDTITSLSIRGFILGDIFLGAVRRSNIHTLSVIDCEVSSFQPKCFDKVVDLSIGLDDYDMCLPFHSDFSSLKKIYLLMQDYSFILESFIPRTVEHLVIDVGLSLKYNTNIIDSIFNSNKNIHTVELINYDKRILNYFKKFSFIDKIILKPHKDLHRNELLKLKFRRFVVECSSETKNLSTCLKALSEIPYVLSLQHKNTSTNAMKIWEVGNTKTH